MQINFRFREDGIIMNFLKRCIKVTETDGSSVTREIPFDSFMKNVTNDGEKPINVTIGTPSYVEKMTNS